MSLFTKPTIVEKAAKIDVEKTAFVRMVDIFEKMEQIRNSAATQPQVTTDPMREDFKNMMAMVVQDGGPPGSDEHFYASHMFREKEYRDAFSCSCFENAEPGVILGWIRRTWEMFMKKKE